MRSVPGWRILGQRAAADVDLGWTQAARAEAQRDGLSDADVRETLRNGEVTVTQSSNPRTVFTRDGVTVVLGAAGAATVIAAHRDR